MKDVRELEAYILTAQPDEVRDLAYAIQGISELRYGYSADHFTKLRDKLMQALQVVFQR